MLKKLSPSLSGWLDVIRSVAASIVAFGHLRGGVFTDYYSLNDSSQNIINFVIFFITRLGIESVVIFFVISGFFVGSPALIKINKQSFKLSQYLVKRLTRLYIVLIPALLIGGLLDVIRIHLTSNQNFLNSLNLHTFLANLAFLQVIVAPPFGSNLPLWFLTCLFWFYIVWPLLISALVSYLPIWKRLILVVPVGFVLWLTYPEILKFFPIWMLGILSYMVPEKVVKPYCNRFSVIISLVLFSITLVGSAFYRNILSYYLLAISFSILLVLLNYAKLPDSQKLWKVGAFFSSFSFTLYLIHYPLQMLLIDLLRDRFGVPFPFNDADILHWFYFVLLNTLVYLFCYAVYLVTERHSSWVCKNIENYLKDCPYTLSLDRFLSCK